MSENVISPRGVGFLSPQLFKLIFYVFLVKIIVLLEILSSGTTLKIILYDVHLPLIINIHQHN